MELKRFTSVDAFLAIAGPYLAAREAEHNLIFGLCATIRSHPEVYEDPWFIAVVDGGEVVGAAMRTPPHNVLLSEMTEPAAVALASAITDELPGVMGPTTVARAFAQQRGAAMLVMNERIFKIERVTPPRPAPGRWRLAEPGDVDLLARWIDAFRIEAKVGAHDDARATAERWLNGIGKTVYFWEDAGHLVAMAAVGGDTPRGIRVGPVYTPPALRGRGYASNVVAAATADQLAKGRTFCFLFTDRANPTSNKIYRALGYEPVTDVDMYRFG